MFINYRCLNKIAMKSNVPLFGLMTYLTIHVGPKYFQRNMYHQI
jgi:hypothetical protein